MDYKILCELSKADLVFALWREFSEVYESVRKRIRSPESCYCLECFKTSLLELYKELEK